MTETVTAQTWYQGEKKILEFTVIDKDTSPGTGPLDLTSYTVRWALSKVGDSGYSTTAVLLKDTSGGGIVKTDAVNGVCQVTILKADTESLAAGNYHQELEVVDGSGEIAVVAVGDVELLKNVVNA